MKKVGAIWRKRKGDKVFFSGEIELIAGIKTPIMLFQFRRKDGTSKTNDPAYDIVLPSERKEEEIKPKIEVIKPYQD